MKPFFKHTDYKFRIKFEYYKPLLLGSPSHSYTAYIRSQFRTYKHTKKANRVRQLIAKFDKQLQQPPAILAIIGDRWLRVSQSRQQEHEKRYTRHLYNIQAHVKTRLTGSLIYPTYHNPPLPRLKPQPLEIHSMIRRRVLKRFNILNQLKIVSGHIHDYTMEKHFFNFLGLSLDSAYIVNLFAAKDYLTRKLDDDYRRSQMKFASNHLIRFRRLHDKRVMMRRRSIEWRKTNHPRLINHWRCYLGDRRRARQRDAARLRLSALANESNQSNQSLKSPTLPPPSRTKHRIRKHTQNTHSKAPYRDIFLKPLSKVYDQLDYNDEPALKVAYDYSKPPQSLLNSSSSPQNINKWSKK
ncbi:hypothetical protein E3P92_02386 [Wallemia ichthyophaga]|nr:hypothetical protein E3P91_02398 [Wallemia ichthyophaga]TIB13166.1 hypothetical protein E3P92_02386 [Wallemia ichthyophaga]TIB62906.1 hypothetical protein E3P78_02156 [Wallemia ichthyophaga]